MRKFDQLIEQKLKLYEAIAPPAPIMPRKPNDPADPTAGTSAVPDINALKAPVATTAPAAGTATPTAGVIQLPLHQSTQPQEHRQYQHQFKNKKVLMQQHQKVLQLMIKIYQIF